MGVLIYTNGLLVDFFFLQITAAVILKRLLTQIPNLLKNVKV